MIATICAANITHYADNGQTIASVSWVDHKGKSGMTSGAPLNTHMQQLLARAEREGVTILRTRAS